VKASSSRAHPCKCVSVRHRQQLDVLRVDAAAPNQYDPEILMSIGKGGSPELAHRLGKPRMIEKQGQVTRRLASSRLDTAIP